ncbi:MAG: DUF1232 domain-containing protein [Chloroflexi bacterium]|nr:DUF1232 domain-containing protein [Chloroflexota bacterium]
MSEEQAIDLSHLDIGRVGNANPVQERVAFFRNLYRRGVLSLRLLFDGRVPFKTKLLPIVVIGYVLSPLDLIPLILTGPLGVIDDLVLITFAIDRFLQNVPPELLVEWAERLGYTNEDAPMLEAGG